MSSSAGDISNLSQAQQEALAQYLSVTNSDTTQAISLLGRCQWNVEIAITRFFDGEPAVDPVAEAQAQEAAVRAAAAQRPPPVPLQRPPHPLIGNPRSSASSSRSRSSDIIPAPRIVPQPNISARRPPSILALFFLPLSVAWRITQGFAYLFSSLFPFLPRLLSNFYSPLNRRGRSTASSRRSLNPRDTASRFIREFEEDNGVTGLPWFEGGYAQALDLAKKDLKFLLVVLLSPEHDDTTSYTKETLSNPEFVKFIKDRDIILWGGSVADSEAYQVSTALMCTKFPFSALITHTPQTSSTAMSVVTRVTGVVSPQKLISKLTAGIAAHSEALNTIRSRRAAEAADRSIRDEQNRAYEASLARDAERARQRRAEEAARLKAEQEEKERQEAMELEEKRLLAWRRWRARSLKAEPEAGPATSRLALTLLDGQRIVRRFGLGDLVEDVYAFVECSGVEAGSESSPPEKYEHQYGFRLVSNLPRKVFEPDQGRTVGDSFGKSMVLIVEPLAHEDDDDESDRDEDEDEE
ncbi:hypothetical protein TWF788_006467 [Orbilia oligospora]|uniref:UBX domain-containing protein n=1 Tax=Orbilia oligospora TaxID=2813651 RepID=A0A7C8PW28_ORBOL|nr:hypothetical protein TWF788_006467 [Orbilia oligospora]KAF3211295.1 hypothetical protein TWF679_006461 [Orbilia oligospora]